MTVAFRTLDGSDKTSWSDPAYGYAYRWPFIKDPQVGDWAIVMGIDGVKCTVVVLLLGIHPDNDYPQDRLVELLDLVPSDEVRCVEERYAADLAAWMNEARYVAGLSPVQVQRTVTERFPSVPPLADCGSTSDPEVAYVNGQQWYRIRRQAEELSFSESETSIYADIARAWFKLGEKLAEAKVDAELTELIDVGALLAPRSALDIGRGARAGRPLYEWLNHARRLARDGDTRRALDVLDVIIGDEAESAQKGGRPSSFAFTERAGIIYRKLRDFASEVAVIERYLAFPGCLRPSDEQAARHRLVKARSLLDKSTRGETKEQL